MRFLYCFNACLVVIFFAITPLLGATHRMPSLYTRQQSEVIPQGGITTAWLQGVTLSGGESAIAFSVPAISPNFFTGVRIGLINGFTDQAWDYPVVPASRYSVVSPYMGVSYFYRIGHSRNAGLLVGGYNDIQTFTLGTTDVHFRLSRQLPLFQVYPAYATNVCFAIRPTIATYLGSWLYISAQYSFLWGSFRFGNRSIFQGPQMSLHVTGSQHSSRHHRSVGSRWR